MDIYSISKRSGNKGKKSGNRGKRRVKRTKRMRTKRNSKRVSRRVSRRRNVKNVKRVSRRRNTKNVKRRSRRRVSRSRTKRVYRRRNRRVMRGGAGTRFDDYPGEFYLRSAEGEDPVHTGCPYAYQIPFSFSGKDNFKWLCFRRNRDKLCPMCDGNTEDSIYIEGRESQEERLGSDDLQLEFNEPDSVAAAEAEFKRRMAELEAGRAAAQMERQQSAAPPIEEPEPAPVVAAPTFRGTAQTVVARNRFTNVWDSELETIEEIQEHINTLSSEKAIEAVINIPNLEKVRALTHFLSFKADHDRDLDEQTKGLIIKLRAIATSGHSCSKANLIKRFDSANMKDMALPNVEAEIKHVINKFAVSKGRKTLDIVMNNIDQYDGQDIREKFLNFLIEEI